MCILYNKPIFIILLKDFLTKKNFSGIFPRSCSGSIHSHIGYPGVSGHRTGNGFSCGQHLSLIKPATGTPKNSQGHGSCSYQVA